MSSPSVGPIEPVKKELGWKWLFVRAAGFGAGFAVILAILAGGGVWYGNRPKPPRAWDTHSITALFENMDISIKNGVVEVKFMYSLQNNTDEDYKITGDEKLFYRTLGSGNLESAEHFVKRVEVFIPAKHKAGYDVIQLYTVGKNAPESVHTAEGMQAFFYKEFHTVDGFVLFDELKRYEIVLPNGWADMKPN